MAMTRNPVEREKALAKVADMYLQGKRQHEIAEALGVAQSTVSNDLKTLRERWLESSLRDFDEAKAQELAKLDQLESTYWEAWFNSLGPERTDKLKGPDTPVEGVVLEREQVTKSSSGNPMFLKGVRECIADRRKILGVDAPTKVAATDADGESVGTGVVVVPPVNNAIEDWVAAAQQWVDSADERMGSVDGSNG